MTRTTTATAATSAWEDLMAAHDRATSARPRTAGPAPDGVPPHRPVAAVLTCADARVSPARSFDLPAGSLFVVRVAGNIATPEAVASLTYAVEHLDVSTVVVLGHTHCGAVTAALGSDEDPALEPLVAPIRPSVSAARCTDIDCAVPANVRATVTELASGDGPLGRAIRDGTVSVHGAVLNLADQSLSPLPTRPTPTPQPKETLQR